MGNNKWINELCVIEKPQCSNPSVALRVYDQVSIRSRIQKTPLKKIVQSACNLIHDRSECSSIVPIEVSIRIVGECNVHDSFS